MASRPWMLLINTTVPECCFRMDGNAAFASKMGPMKLVCIIFFSTSGVVSSLNARMPNPLLITSTSIEPQRFNTFYTSNNLTACHIHSARELFVLFHINKHNGILRFGLVCTLDNILLHLLQLCFAARTQYDFLSGQCILDCYFYV